MNAKRAAEVSLSGALPKSPLDFPAKGSQSAARTDRPPGAGDPTLADWAVFSPTYMPPEKMISLPSPPAGGELWEA